MITPSTHLFEQLPTNIHCITQELTRPHLTHHFTHNNLQLTLTLTDNYILLAQPSQHTPTHFCKLQFQLKFQVLYQPSKHEEFLGLPLAFKLQRENCDEQLTFYAHPSTIETWSLQLQKKINQRNFHKLFKAKKKIGKGAFATVYLAERLRDHQMVAVKAFSKQKQYAGDKGKLSLENEIKIMRKLNHPNLMHLLGVYETENSIYLILQYLEGLQLNEMLKSSPKWTASETHEILLNILRGLTHLAQHRIIHRDLKPENIMFRRNGSCDLAICDFGLATCADEPKYLFVRCGTPGYVAPEIINIRDMDTKSQPISDVFSAGIIFHHLLLGCSVFPGKKYNQILNQNRSCQINLSQTLYSDLNPQILDLLAKMLEKDPRKRISAENALNHPYFTQQMDAQKGQTKIFQNLTNCPYSYHTKKTEASSTTCCKKRQIYDQDYNNHLLRPYGHF